MLNNKKSIFFKVKIINIKSKTPDKFKFNTISEKNLNYFD